MRRLFAAIAFFTSISANAATTEQLIELINTNNEIVVQLDTSHELGMTVESLRSLLAPSSGAINEFKTECTTDYLGGGLFDADIQNCTLNIDNRFSIEMKVVAPTNGKALLRETKVLVFHIW